MRRLSPAVLQSVGADGDLARVDAATGGGPSRRCAGRTTPRRSPARRRPSRLLDELAASECSPRCGPTGEPGSSPFPADWSTLPELARVAVAAAGSSASPALLPGGDFENLRRAAGRGLAAHRSARRRASTGAVRLVAGRAARRRVLPGAGSPAERRRRRRRRRWPRRRCGSPRRRSPCRRGTRGRDHRLGPRRGAADRLGRPAADFRLDRRRGIGRADRVGAVVDGRSAWSARRRRAPSAG